MSEMRGKVCLIVNVASNCGFTPQYKGLQELYDKYGKDGKFEVIAFPSNSFNQEKGSTEEICAFTKDRFKVTFKIMEKIEVNGDNAHPIYQFLKQEGPGGFLGSTNIKWNFTKFLINKEGKVIGRYAPTTDPLSIAKDIEKALKD
ncbi:predicted protein [Naegleria gruberi]|uniref:Glutathione peroxidase n=1 Tax=Naegleria gruberi TaxID=5762 RepID=D2VQB1_NAEGR|nr:uncharacterized protein NAEGRDRAFT_44697 [Naegleria gruberi]EFC41080.1 predicted protein [Naegleria gruberi]|eukprot:XP_002673824.1 predicted protein [Naegleria gruberi strain NEG-M]